MDTSTNEDTLPSKENAADVETSDMAGAMAVLKIVTTSNDDNGKYPPPFHRATFPLLLYPLKEPETFKTRIVLVGMDQLHKK